MTVTPCRHPISVRDIRIVIIYWVLCEKLVFAKCELTSARPGCWISGHPALLRLLSYVSILDVIQQQYREGDVRATRVESINKCVPCSGTRSRHSRHVRRFCGWRGQVLGSLSLWVCDVYFWLSLSCRAKCRWPTRIWTRTELLYFFFSCTRYVGHVDMLCFHDEVILNA